MMTTILLVLAAVALEIIGDCEDHANTGISADVGDGDHHPAAAAFPKQPQPQKCHLLVMSHSAHRSHLFVSARPQSTMPAFTLAAKA